MNTRVRDELDPDELAMLEESRDSLLRSLDDLDAEFAVGDIDADDYHALRDDYTARAAEVLRSIEQRTDLAATRRAESRRPGRGLMWVAGAVAVAAVAGLLLARSTGARGAGTSLTGSANDARSARTECKSLSFQQPAKGIACFTKLLASDPADTESLTYRGWASLRVGDAAAATADFDKVVSIDPTYPDVYVFRASARKRSGDFAGAQSELDTLYQLNPPAEVISTLQDQGLDQEIALGLLDPAVQACWKSAATFTVEAANSSTTVPAGQPIPGFDAQVACFDAILATNGANVDALVGKAALIERVGPESSWPVGEAAADAALAARPKDPDALLVRALLRYLQGKTTFTEDVGALAGLATKPSALLAADVAGLKRIVEALTTDRTTTTTGGG